MADKGKLLPKLTRRGSMSARKSMVNIRWTGDKPVDMTEEYAVKNAVINTLTRRSTWPDMEHEGFRRMATLQQGLEKVVERTLAGKANDDHEHFDDNPELMTNAQAMLNLINNCLGSALLTIGYSVMHMGVIGGALTIVFAGLINRHTCVMAMEVSTIAKEDPATTAANERALGKPGKIIQLIVFFGIGFSCMCSYLTASTDAVLSFLKLFHFSFTDFKGCPEDCLTSPTCSQECKSAMDLNEKIVTVLCWFFLNFPPSLIRSLKSMATFSMIAFIGALFMVSAIVLCSMQQLYVRGAHWENITLFPADSQAFIAGFPTIVMIFAIQAGTGPILGGMQDSSDANIQKQINRIFIFVICLFNVIGLSVYLAFDKKTDADVLKVLPDTDVLGIIARVGALVLVVLSYMIMMVPCKLAIIESLFGKNEALMEASLLQYYGTTVGLNLCCLGVALVVSDLAIIFGFLAAFISPVLSWWLPCCAKMGILALPEIESRPWLSCKNWSLWLINLFGVSLCAMGTYTLYGLLTK